MFSKELESLIQATLEDGKLEDFEKAALAKRAQAEGVDLAELEIYINSLLQRRARELNQKREEELNMLSKQKKEAFGRVCPNCGAQVQAMTLRCDCGYEFTNAKAVSSVQLLFDKLNNITLTPSDERAIDNEQRPMFKEDVRNRIILEKKIILFQLSLSQTPKKILLNFFHSQYLKRINLLAFLKRNQIVLYLFSLRVLLLWDLHGSQVL